MDSENQGEDAPLALPVQGECPSVTRQLGMALFVLAMGPKNTGIATKHGLMWPYTNYNDNDVSQAAVNLLAHLLVAQLEAVPAARIAQIQTDQAAFLSFVCADGSLDGRNPSEAYALRPPA